MALSFVLQSLVSATPLQAFAAGAALCSTSLGTTFTILNTSGLSTTRLGTVLSSAAMMDDVIGLVMVQVISNLGGTIASFNAVTVVRPLAVSAGLAIAVPLICKFIAQPMTLLLNDVRKSSKNEFIDRIFRGQYTALIIHTLVLIVLVTGATYAGTSNLFAAYLAGASVSWWDSEVPHLNGGINTAESSSPQRSNGRAVASPELLSVTPRGGGQNPQHALSAVRRMHEEYASTGNEVYYIYYEAAVKRILKPLFFVGNTPLFFLILKTLTIS